MLLIPLLLMLHSFQGLGNCEASPTLRDVDSAHLLESTDAAPVHDDKVPLGDTNQSGLADIMSSMATSSSNLHDQREDDTDGEEEQRKVMFLRERRHIGSIAAFRGLPGPFNKFANSPMEWSAEKKGMAEDDDFGKERRYPDVLVQQKKVVPNPVLMRNAPKAPVYTEVVAPPHNEARARAVNRLLRLLAEAQGNSKKASYISKKFLGALAKNNGLPANAAYPKALPSIQYKGSTAIPLPGKRGIGPAVMYEDGRNGWFDNYEDYADHEDDSDASDDDDDEILGDYEDGKFLAIKRHIGSLAKSGIFRQSRGYNRVPQL